MKLSLWADELRPGQELVSAPRAIEARDVEAFAELTGDRHPQHLEADWAASSIFGERVVHGLLVVACAAGALDFDPERVVALRRVRDLKFKRPMRLGASLRLHCRVAAIAPVGHELALVTLAWRIVDDGDATLARAAVDVLWRRAPAPA